MIQLLLIDTIGDAYISTVHKYTTPDVDNSNVRMQIKIETQKLFTTTRYANSTDHTGRYYTQRITDIHTPLAELFTRGPSSDRSSHRLPAKVKH